MAGKPVGTAYAEIDLDSNKMEKGLKRVHDQLVNGTIKTEDAFKQLGIKSDSVYETMRKNAELAFNKIVTSARSTANDRAKAEQELTSKLQTLYQQQYGYHKSALDKMSESTLGLGKSVSSLSGMILTAAAAMASMKVANYATDTAMLAARYETLGVVMGVVGNNVGHTKAEMEGFSQALQKTGISMNESRQTITSMAMAHLDLTKATEMARIAQDAAVIGNTNSSEALKRMVYGIQSAQVEVLRTMGINVSFEESYKKVAAATNRTTESLSEAEKMTIRMNAVLAVGPTIAGAYEAAMDTAGKKIGSFSRYAEDFQVKMGTAFGPALVILIDAATEAMKEMQVQIARPEAQKAIESLSKALAETVVQLGNDLPGKISKIAGALQSMADLYNKLPSDVVGAAGAGIIGSMLFGKGAGLIIAGITLTSSKIDDFKKQHPEIFGGQAEVLRFKIPASTVGAASDLMNDIKTPFENINKTITTTTSNIKKAKEETHNYFDTISKTFGDNTYLTSSTDEFKKLSDEYAKLTMSATDYQKLSCIAFWILALPKQSTSF